MNILIIPSPTFSHVAPTSRLIRCLVELGHNPYCLLPNSFRKLIESYGGNLLPFEADISRSEIADAVSGSYLTILLLEKYYAHLEELKRLCDGIHLDLIISDVYLPLAGPLSFRYNIPFAAYHCMHTLGTEGYYPCVSTLNPYYQGSAVIRNLCRLIKSFHWELGKKEFDPEDARILFGKAVFCTIPSWLDPAINIHPIDPRVNYLGASSLDNSHLYKKLDELGEIDANQKVIYLALGSIIDEGQNIYQKFINWANLHPEYTLVISTNNRKDKVILHNVPPNVVILNWVSQIDILRKADIFVTHAGIGSVIDGIQTSTRMLLVPQVNEQRNNANKLRELGLGIIANSENLDIDSIDDYIRSVWRLKDENLEYYRSLLARDEANYHIIVARILSELGL